MPDMNTPHHPHPGHHHAQHGAHHAGSPAQRPRRVQALPAPDRGLSAWLDRCAPLSPEYGSALSTHLPMALHALHALGAPPSRLGALFDQVAPRIPRRDPAAAGLPAPARWPAHLGQFAAFEALHRGMADIARHQGAAALLTQALPVLLPGVSAVAFHGLIRTAHGVAAGHAGEVVTGLAYWAARHQLLQPADGAAFTPPATLALADWLAALQALPRPAGPPARLIAQRMQAWAAVPGFFAVAPALAGGPGVLDGLARHAAALYAASGNFTVLHLVTTCHALGVLQPWWPDGPDAWRPVVVAAAAALRASGLAELQAPPPPDHLPPWADTVARATQSTDEHVVKLVQACHALHRRLGGPVFQAAAARAVATTGAVSAPASR